jgi:hypothetical protein
VLPAENADLTEAITASGALVSQFWPTSPPSRYMTAPTAVADSGQAEFKLAPSFPDLDASDA